MELSQVANLHDVASDVGAGILVEVGFVSFKFG